MTRWRLGESEIDALIAERMLQRVTGDQADAEAWVDRARRTLATAAGVVDGDPESAFVLGYDAARQACTALLARQGLRPTTRGGHLVVEQAVRAQFGESFAAFGALRRRRNQVEYPSFPGERMDAAEARAALTRVNVIVEAAARLLPDVGFY